MTDNLGTSCRMPQNNIAVGKENQRQPKTTINFSDINSLKKKDKMLSGTEEMPFPKTLSTFKDEEVS